jgi:hypothetical protein
VRLYLGLECQSLVTSVAKRFVLGMAATTKADGCTASQPEFLAVLVADGEFTLNTQRAIVPNSDFRQAFPPECRHGIMPE